MSNNSILFLSLLVFPTFGYSSYHFIVNLNFDIELEYEKDSRQLVKNSISMCYTNKKKGVSISS